MARINLTFNTVQILQDEEWGSTHVALYASIIDSSTGNAVKDANGNPVVYQWNNLGGEVDEVNTYGMSGDANFPNQMLFDVTGKVLVTLRGWADDDQDWPNASNNEDFLGSVSWTIDPNDPTTLGTRSLGPSTTDNGNAGFVVNIQAAVIQPAPTSVTLPVSFINLRLFQDEEWGSTNLAIYVMAQGPGINQPVFKWNNGGNEVDEVNTYDLTSGGANPSPTVTLSGPTTLTVAGYADDDTTWPDASNHENFLGSASIVIDPNDHTTWGARQFPTTTTDNGNPGFQINVEIGAPVSPLFKIKHLFVVMMENRSFDHMLGFSGIQGVDGLGNGADQRYFNVDSSGNRINPTNDAKQKAKADPPHEFESVQTQLLGNGTDYDVFQDGVDQVQSVSAPTSAFGSGFINSAGSTEPMKCFDPSKLPILNQLASEFAVCDRWFSSIPGPTWPNRFFLHAASSGGLSASPWGGDVAASYLWDSYSFENGTIFDTLNAQGISWRVYYDGVPQTLAFKGMMDEFFTDKFKDFDEMKDDLNDDDGFDVSYVFIEPNYLPVDENDQHPTSAVYHGEKFIKKIYEQIRNSPVWNESVLVILYDEHGGFYDHVFPSRAVPPGDDSRNMEDSESAAGKAFKFDRYGVRVPAIVVSPLIPGQTVDHTIYDHTSVLATLEKRFSLQSLTNRDALANTIEHLVSLTVPRTDAPAKLNPVYKGP